MNSRSLPTLVRAAAPMVTAAAAAALVIVSAAPASAQTSIARVKEFYANASYEEALRELALVQPDAPLTRVTDAAAYEVFCLVALGREDEATEAISEIVRVDPLYQPPETEVAPRIITFFEKVRRPLLPGIVRDLYANAKALVDSEPAEAKKQFDRVIALLDELGGADPDLADLRTLAVGFRDLASINAARAAAPPPPPPPPPAPVVAAAPEPPPPPPPPPEPVIYSVDDADVAPPVALSRTLPPWRATTAVEKLQTFRGQLEIVVDENGGILSSRMLRGLRPDYDPMLLKSVTTWKFRPATKDGKPVRYRYVMELELNGGRD